MARVVPHVVVEAICPCGAAEGVDFEERVGDWSCTIASVGVHCNALEHDAEDAEARM
jgi:hypothetical protein